MKGIPSAYFKHFAQIEFLEQIVNIPVMVGSVLDWWYPNWFFPKTGVTSSDKAICRVFDFNKPEEWEIL